MRIFKDFVLGQYYPAISWVHQRDPRAKLFFVIVAFFALFAFPEWPVLLLWLAALVFACRLARLPVEVVISAVRPFLWIFLLTFLLQFLSVGTSGSLFALPQTAGAMVDAVTRAAFFALRLAAFVALSAMLTLVTSPMELADAMESLLAPFKRFRLPVHELSLMASIAVRFVPTIAEEAERLRRAQMARGARFDGDLRQRIRALVPLVVPLFFHTLRRAEELALAMEARCYDRRARRTRYYRLAWRREESVVAAVAVALFLASWMIGVVAHHA